MLQRSFSNLPFEAGCDEAGRGCLAGPVFAAAVILPADFENDILRDSKKLNASQREVLYDIICDQAESYAISSINAQKIDEINILNASILAMHEALKKLNRQPDYIIVDGNRFKPFGKTPFKCVIKGDDKFYSIAAASVLAKVARDRYMKTMSEKFPHYDWHNNKGYPTRSHREGIKQYGPSPIHRMSFRLLQEQTQLDLFN